MDEQDFKLLSILNETRNITHAADKLYITQSSVSKRILQLERELGVTLMLRSRQGIHFTPAGEIVLQHTNNIMAEINSMRQKLKYTDNVISGTLKAGASINYTRYCLADHIIAYNNAYPSVTSQIITASSHKLYNMLINGEIDVGILRGEYDSWRGEKILLNREKICLITSHENMNKSLNELTPITWQSNLDTKREIMQWLHENKISMKKNNISVDSTATCVNMVDKGIGWGIVPEMCLKNFNGYVCPLYFSNGEPVLRSTYIMYFKQVSDLPQIKAFIELICKNTINSKLQGGMYHV